MKISSETILVLSELPGYGFLYDQPELVSKQFEEVGREYADLLLIFSNLNKQDIDILDTEFVTDSFDASRNSLASIYELLGDFRQRMVSDINRQLEEPKEELIASSLKVATAMLNAHKLNVSNANGYDFRDGDRRSDAVRWSYLKMNSDDPKLLISYVVAHTIDVFAVSWIEQNLESERLRELGIDLGKDGFLGALRGVIDLCKAMSFRGKFYGASQVYQRWATPKDLGGHGWTQSR